jgi:NAD(P)-dependent dehydrogenase (short-subunit alcohol dehydrogenase family)
MEKDFAGKAAIVTGGASGIGEAIALELAARGAKVLVADLDAGAAGEVVERIGKAGGEARPYGLDVADPEAVRAMVEAAQEAFGGLHLAVNNAGIGGRPLTRSSRWIRRDQSLPINPKSDTRHRDKSPLMTKACNGKNNHVRAIKQWLKRNPKCATESFFLTP